MTNRLQWDVLVSAQIPVVTIDLPPGASEMKWSPISSTLISGKRDAADGQCVGGSFAAKQSRRSPSEILQ